MKTSRFQLWVLFCALAAILIAGGCNRNQSASRSDQEIAQEIQGRINSDPNLPNKQITVNALNGTVTLSGTVATDTERMAASNDASTVPGVKQVINNLSVAPLAAAGASDFPSNQNAQPGPSRSPDRSAQARSKNRATSTKGVGNTQASNVNTATTGNSRGPTSTVAQVTVPAGTNLTILINDALSSETATVGDKFTGVLDESVYVENEIAIPKNADVEGRVVDAKNASKFKGQSLLALELTSVSFNGRQYELNTGRWAKQGAARGKNTAAKVGGGAAIGAVIGAIAGGGKGAAIGAGVGAGAGTAAQAITRGEQVVLKPETMLQFSLEAPVKVTPSASTRRSAASSGE